MKVLAINAGSSSLKYQLFEMPSETVLCSGIAERIGMNDGIFSLKVNGEKFEEVLEIPNHSVAVELLLKWLIDHKIISDYNEIQGVGHRVVHGGEHFAASAMLTEENIQLIEDVAELAPLHNPANLTGIYAFKKLLPDAVAVAVFDTAFHQTLAEEAYMYSTPYEWYEKYAVRKYGFHGTSHQYVSAEAARLIGKAPEDAKVIVCHLGNGGSLSAVKNGKSVDTTMGFTPLAGIPMGTRSGDIDPAIIPFIMEKTGQTAAEVVDMLNKKSGFLGVSGLSSDARDIEAGINEGNHRAELAAFIYAKRIAEYIAAYHVYLEGADVIAFTAGIGENAPYIRKCVTRRLGVLGVKLDEAVNESIRGKEAIISTDDSAIKIAVVPTNEELVIARDTLAFMN
ncbi:acetate kinase [Culicoidibacter larvae]|uniref:Acetate kinase n=1 Tax=Culicoidibacter larvae TaxID=2579976 RepID=A0A5R8Q8U1_9FIRM|nr:acetate kinase [Culicoidibacter larvae]TLG72132.1 acetate kinase [Culicoidibacter larvae]